MNTSRAAASKAALVTAPRSAGRTVGCGTSVVIRLSPPTQCFPGFGLPTFGVSPRLAPGCVALGDKATPAGQAPRIAALAQGCTGEERPPGEGGLCDDRERGRGPRRARAGRSDGRAGDARTGPQPGPGTGPGDRGGRDGRGP